MKYLKKYKKSTFLIEPATSPAIHRCLVHKIHFSRESLKKINEHPNKPFEFVARIDSFLDGDIYFKEVDR